MTKKKLKLYKKYYQILSRYGLKDKLLKSLPRGKKYSIVSDEFSDFTIKGIREKAIQIALENKVQKIIKKYKGVKNVNKM